MRLPSDYAAPKQEQEAVEYIWEQKGCVQQRREPIVRCRDCEYAYENESGALRCHGYLVDSWDYYNDEPSNGVKVKPDGFCAWAERRDADNASD